MKIPKKDFIKILEKDIEKACTDLLELDGWRSFKMEQNFSERKRKTVGERGMPDRLYIRYAPFGICQVLWIEFKSATGRASLDQQRWHWEERLRGAMTGLAGKDFPPTIEGFRQWYITGGLNHRIRNTNK